jgi:dihydroflavonol-4-reductase
VLPTAPIGPGDRAPTPTGKIVLDFLNGRMPGYVDTVLNVVHVDDVAAGHLLAHDKGRVGRSYIVGGGNMTLAEILGELADITGLKKPRIRVPRGVAFAAGRVSEAVEGRLLHRQPSVPLEAVRMSTTRMAFDDSRARSELGYTSRPARAALLDSVRWYLDNGYVKPSRAARMRPRLPTD